MTTTSDSTARERCDGDSDCACSRCFERNFGAGAQHEHDCWENAIPYESDGAIGHGFECAICGAFLQAG